MKMKIFLSTAAGLAQSVERSTAEREVAGSIPGTGPKALQMARPSRGSNDHVKRLSRLH